MQQHKPVLIKEVLQYLKPKAGESIVDCTFGQGGHASKILKKVKSKGLVLGLDFNQDNIEQYKKKFKPPRNLILIQENFKNLKQILRDQEIGKVDGILLDLGFSSNQLDQIAGLSFLKPEMRLDMLINDQVREKKTAKDLLNQANQVELEKIFQEYGEIKNSNVLAKRITKSRQQKNFETVQDLIGFVRNNKDLFRNKRMNPATKLFMALRIAVNHELDNLKAFLKIYLDCLKTRGRIVFISFHSLEDRMIKLKLKQDASNCICAEDEFQCKCDHKAEIELLTKKPIRPTQEEIRINPRSRSAKLRAGIKI
ncbi:MAG: 16S rRNA (cytosine(1402)-N(4))-methyltransferase RsmH [Candidatus Moranbacteria bacterium]|nr:16S rRNA (cytosine(1402)-N(4))-methyltransferase RsmH [Candidatus Moranbacteria bacterium]